MRRGPERIVTTDEELEIFNPQLGVTLRLAISAEGFRGEHVRLPKDQEEKIVAQLQFQEIARRLIVAMVDHEAVKLRRGSEDIAPELEVISYETQFDNGMEILRKLHLSDKDVMGLIDGSGRQISPGETHMGEIPQIVKEQILKLQARVLEAYLVKARVASRQRTTHPR